MRKLLILLSIITLSMIFTSCTKGIVNNKINDDTNKITLDEAKEIVLKHANLEANQVSFIKSEYDVDGGIKKYDIEFYYNNKEYDYEIDAKSGEIIEYDYDIENYNNGQKIDNSNKQKITIEEAKDIVLNHSGLHADQVSFAKLEYDIDDVYEKYDIEFYYNNKEYDYEVDANTGDIIRYDYDIKSYSVGEQLENEKITVEEAKNIALKYSNLEANQVSFIKSEYEIDDGIEKYDIEFHYNNKKYECEINANNGEIIKYEIDK